LTESREARRGPALAVLCVAQFVNVLDVTVVLVALPSIWRDLGLPQEDLQWVVSAYALFFAGCLLRGVVGANLVASALTATTSPIGVLLTRYLQRGSPWSERSSRCF
jgi:MFS family permease